MKASHRIFKARIHVRSQLHKTVYTSSLGHSVIYDPRNPTCPESIRRAGAYLVSPTVLHELMYGGKR